MTGLQHVMVYLNAEFGTNNPEFHNATGMTEGNHILYAQNCGH
jgi:hypothetical protein